MPQNPKMARGKMACTACKFTLNIDGHGNQAEPSVKVSGLLLFCVFVQGDFQPRGAGLLHVG